MTIRMRCWHRKAQAFSQVVHHVNDMLYSVHGLHEYVYTRIRTSTLGE